MIAASPSGVLARRLGGRPVPTALGSAEVPRHRVRLMAIECAAGGARSAPGWERGRIECAAGGARSAPGWERGRIEDPQIAIAPFASLAQRLRPGDLVVVNDAATLPGALSGSAAGAPFELRVTGPIAGGRLAGVLFGAGDWRTRTEDRPPPPVVREGDRVMLAGAPATVIAVRGRRVELAVADPLALVYGHGAPVQYAHRAAQLPLWAVQTGYAARPWAAEMPSAGRPLTWDVLLGLRRAGIAITTLTHAAGLSSTGDAALDAALPWPERYEIPDRTRAALAAATRVIAVGTTVVRALEADALGQAGTATLRIDVRHRLRVVDGLVSGLHVPGESHFELLSAFAPRRVLVRALDAAAAAGLSAHELGDACLITARRSP